MGIMEMMAILMEQFKYSQPRQNAEEFIKKLKEEMKKGKRPGEQFSDYYNQTVVEIEIE